MDPLHFAIAAGPLAAYACLLGLINLGRRPFLTTAARDAAALGIAVSGLVVAGPMELFLPEAAANRFGGYVWALLLSLYLLCLLLVVLLLKPRLVIYNVELEQLRPVLAGVVEELDPSAHWAGVSLVMPKLGVQLHLEALPLLRNVQLVSAGTEQSFEGWRKLETALVAALRETRGEPNPYGLMFISLGALVAAFAALWMASDVEGVAHALNIMLRQ